mgnify:CR=1 FL=1
MCTTEHFISLQTLNLTIFIKLSSHGTSIDAVRDWRHDLHWQVAIIPGPISLQVLLTDQRVCNIYILFISYYILCLWSHDYCSAYPLLNRCINISVYLYICIYVPTANAYLCYCIKIVYLCTFLQKFWSFLRNCKGFQLHYYCL